MEQSYARVLIVDDEPDMVQIYGDVLRHVGYTVISANDGETALALARENPPDVILLDVMLPGESGFELLPKFKALDPDVQVIIFTVLDEAGKSDRATQAGACDYLVKPAPFNKVRAAVAKAWEIRKNLKKR